MAWDLINEPICNGCPEGTMASWVKEMGPYVKELDSNHLLTVWEEGEPLHLTALAATLCDMKDC